ncbi:MAG TPA: hypothetical protein VEX68_20190 [Bryobacteraceae bacterium]|nr:hypothetical protein [Bryobacteraceae bacterium]
MKTLPQDRDAAIEANRATIEGRHVRVVETFDSWEEAVRSAKYMSKKFERTLNAGWNLQIIVFHEHL